MRKFGWKLFDLGIVGIGLVITSIGWECLVADCSKKEEPKAEEAKTE